jgi:replicative DNA helicase
LMPGQLCIIAGRSGCGKTALGMQVVYSVLAQMEERGDLGVICVFSAEMDGESLMLREACAIEKISYWRVQSAECSKSEYARLDERLAQMGSRRVYIDESPAPTLEHMIGQLKALADEGQQIAMVLFDYTELAGEYDKDESKRVNKISRGLAAIAKQFRCPVLTLSQLNRDIEARADKTPSMRDLMHGGERDAATIVILVRPWSYDKASPKELVNAYVVKNRFGKQGDATLGFDETSLRFYSATVERKEFNKGADNETD